MGTVHESVVLVGYNIHPLKRVDVFSFGEKGEDEEIEGLGQIVH